MVRTNLTDRKVRAPKLSDELIAYVETSISDGLSFREICAEKQISKSAFYKWRTRGRAIATQDQTNLPPPDRLYRDLFLATQVQRNTRRAPAVTAEVEPGCPACAKRSAWTRLKKMRKRARLNGTLSIPFTLAELNARLSMFPGCWMCEGTKEVIDHVIPTTGGGPTCLSNLRPACTRCNARKGSMSWRLFV